VTDSYVCQDSFLCVPLLISMCAMTHFYVCHDWIICVPWLIHMCAMTHFYVCHDASTAYSKSFHGSPRNFRTSFHRSPQNFKQGFSCVNGRPLLIPIYSLLHLQYHLISISNLNLVGLFSLKCGKRDPENEINECHLRLKTWQSHRSLCTHSRVSFHRNVAKET